MPKQTLSFRGRYIVLTVVILLVSLVLTALFYPRLPAELAYSFKPGGTDSSASRGVFLIWTLAPQFLMVLLAAGVVLVVARLNNRVGQAGNRLMAERTLSLMGNMFVLPQLILSFAMLDVFLYNLYQIHLMPLWVFALLVMVLGAISLGLFFVQAMRQAAGSKEKL